MTKAVALLSGGLDSTLAVKLMIDQGIEVHAMNFTSSFCTCDAGAKNKDASADGCKGVARQVSEKFGVPIKVIHKGLEYVDIIRNPKYGHGKGINPCVDCRIYMFKAAKEYMKEIGASFIITGEVIGQRPMSQRRANFYNIERDCALEGMILRPLCAKNLDPTKAELEGLVDREQLMDIAGRGRRPQMDKAEELEIDDYPCPSGGCLLTDKIFSKKVRDLLDHKESVTIKDLQLLKAGRHFRFNGVKVVVGKDEADNNKINNLVQPGDTLIEPIDFAGPVALIAGAVDEEITSFVLALIKRYTADKSDADSRITLTKDGASEELPLTTFGGKFAETIDETTVQEYNVC